MTTPATNATKSPRKGLRETKALLLLALRAKAGLVSPACEAVKIHRSSYYRWFEKDRRFREAVEDVREELLDLAESKLIQAVKAGQGWAVKFYLQAKGKHRGWCPRTELTGPDGQELLPSMAAEIEEDRQFVDRLLQDERTRELYSELLGRIAGPRTPVQ